MARSLTDGISARFRNPSWQGVMSLGTKSSEIGSLVMGVNEMKKLLLSLALTLATFEFLDHAKADIEEPWLKKWNQDFETAVRLNKEQNAQTIAYCMKSNLYCYRHVAYTEPSNGWGAEMLMIFSLPFFDQWSGISNNQLIISVPPGVQEKVASRWYCHLNQTRTRRVCVEAKTGQEYRGSRQEAPKDVRWALTDEELKKTLYVETSDEKDLSTPENVWLGYDNHPRPHNQVVTWPTIGLDLLRDSYVYYIFVHRCYDVRQRYTYVSDPEMQRAHDEIAQIETKLKSQLMEGQTTDDVRAEANTKANNLFYSGREICQLQLSSLDNIYNSLSTAKSLQ